MKTMKKIVAILAVALLLCSMLPLSVMAAEETATLSFADKAQRISFSTSAQIWEQNGIKLTNNKAASTSNVADYAKPARFYASSEIIIECAGMTKIEFDCNNSSYATALKNSIGTTATVSSDKVTVELDGVDSFKIAKLTAQVRMDAITVTYEAGSANCDHANLDCETTCPECGEYTKEHAWNNACDNECNNCGAANPDYAEHVYTTDYDATCNVCNESRDITLPTTPEEIVEAAYALDKGDTFGVSVTLTGVITKIVTAYDSSYANITVNMAVIDSEGNTIADKDVQCYRLKGEGADTLAVGHTIVVTGVITNFNGTIEFNAGCTLDEIIINCTHDYEYECSKSCYICGIETRPEAECSPVGDLCQDSECEYCGEIVAGIGHQYDDQWDPDCNECGETREVEERPELTEATVTFDEDKTQRTEYSTELQKWENGGLTVLNNKAGSTTNVGDYSNPGRVYKSSEIVITFPGMVTLIIDCSNTGEAKYSTPFGDMLTAAGLTYTVTDKVYTVTFAEPVDSITLTCSAQVRANAITAIAKKVGDDDCAHIWVDATCTAPKTCSECGATEGAALGHNYVADIIDSTCTVAGSASYECSVCFDSYDEIIPVKPHNYVGDNCADCGAEKPLFSTITFDDAKTQRVEYSSDIQVWENDGLNLTNNKSGSSNPVGDYSGRFYKSSEIIISYAGMSSLVIDATGIGADHLWDATLEAAGLNYTVADQIYTIVFAEPVDSITMTAANQVRAISITAYGTKKDEPACEHVYDDDYDADCNLCGDIREVPEKPVDIIYGDANGDGEVTTRDVTLLQQYMAGWDVTLVVESADANGDGEVTTRDVTLLQQFMAGWEVTLGPV